MEAGLGVCLTRGGGHYRAAPAALPSLLQLVSATMVKGTIKRITEAKASNQLAKDSYQLAKNSYQLAKDSYQLAKSTKLQEDHSIATLPPESGLVLRTHQTAAMAAPPSACRVEW